MSRKLKRSQFFLGRDTPLKYNACADMTVLVQHVGVEVQEIEGRGRGLRATASIPAGTIVVEEEAMVCCTCFFFPLPLFFPIQASAYRQIRRPPCRKMAVSKQLLGLNPDIQAGCACAEPPRPLSFHPPRHTPTWRGHRRCRSTTHCTP